MKRSAYNKNIWKSVINNSISGHTKINNQKTNLPKIEKKY